MDFKMIFLRFFWLFGIAIGAMCSTHYLYLSSQMLLKPEAVLKNLLNRRDKGMSIYKTKFQVILGGVFLMSFGMVMLMFLYLSILITRSYGISFYLLEIISILSAVYFTFRHDSNWFWKKV